MRICFWFWIRHFNLTIFDDFEQVKKLIVILLTLKKSKNLIFILLNLNKSKIKWTTRLPWEKVDAWAFSFWKLGHLVFWFTSLLLNSQLDCSWLPTPHCAVLCDLQGIIPSQWSPSAFYPTPCLGRQRISLGVAIFLSICLCSRT